jgi:hypothetical protein
MNGINKITNENLFCFYPFQLITNQAINSVCILKISSRLFPDKSMKILHRAMLNINFFDPCM